MCRPLSSLASAILPISPAPLPGNGERIFAATQDDEMAFAAPGKGFVELGDGLKKVGKAIGARYPVTPYLNFQPDFPKAHKELGKELGIL